MMLLIWEFLFKHDKILNDKFLTNDTMITYLEQIQMEAPSMDFEAMKCT